MSDAARAFRPRAPLELTFKEPFTMIHSTRTSSQLSLARGSFTHATAATLLLLAACGGATSQSPATAPSARTPDQQARGAEVFSKSCAKCHGEKGTGGTGDAPAVMGAGALPLEAPNDADDRKAVKFKTAQDVFAFTKQFMPDHHGGSLTDQQYWDVTAFMLMGRGVDLAGKTLDATNAPTIVVNP